MEVTLEVPEVEERLMDELLEDIMWDVDTHCMHLKNMRDPKHRMEVYDRHDCNSSPLNFSANALKGLRESHQKYYTNSLFPSDVLSLILEYTPQSRYFKMLYRMDIRRSRNTMRVILRRHAKRFRTRLLFDPTFAVTEYSDTISQLPQQTIGVLVL